MATNPISREDPFPLSSSTYCSSSSSSPIPTSDHLGVSTTRSASNSFQNDAGGFLNDFPAASASTCSSLGYNDAEFGFSRAEFRQGRLFGTVQFYERHVFLCYKNPSVWPTRVEAAEFDRLPRLLSAAVSSRKAEMERETRLTICEGHDGTETSNGDVLIFPDMTIYRRLTHFDVDTFVEEVLVKNGEWLPGTPEMLKGSYVFVCCHESRDRRCGVCGPALISRFKEEIEAHGLQGLVSVSACSHIGGHKYAGNVIIFASGLNGGVTGHWYGYVTPDDVPTLLEQHVGKGEIVDWLWRGQMGLTEEEQIQFHELRLQLNGEAGIERNEEDSAQGPKDLANTATHMSEIEVASCCHQDGESSCCQNPISIEKRNPDAKEMDVKVTLEKKKSSKKLLTQLSSGKGSYKHKVCAMPTWFESWEREDTYAVLAVVFAAASVTVAYSCYKQLQ